MAQENPQLWRDLPPLIKEAVYARVRRQLPRIVRNITDEIGENIDQLIDAKLMVIRYFSRAPRTAQRAVPDHGSSRAAVHEELRILLRIADGVRPVRSAPGAIPSGTCCRIGGVIIGWTVNWLGIEMIFEPVHPTKWLPWHQGLLIKRQPEVTEAYAQMVADKVITLQNIGDELMTGPRSDRTVQLLEDALRPAVDDAIGSGQNRGSGRHRRPGVRPDPFFAGRRSQRVRTDRVRRRRVQQAPVRQDLPLHRRPDEPDGTRTTSSRCCARRSSRTSGYCSSMVARSGCSRGCSTSASSGCDR